MYVIGVTGGIGTGKTTVCNFLKELGATVFDLDRIGHESYKKDTPCYEELVTVFGAHILSEDGEIDRKKLGAIVFSDETARERLNAIVWPAMKAILEKKFHEAKEQGTQIAVLEAAILIEAGWQDLADEIWATIASEKSVIERLEKRDGLDRKETAARIAAQAPPALYAEHADVVINTDRSMEELSQIVSVLWAQRLDPQ